MKLPFQRTSDGSDRAIVERLDALIELQRQGNSLLARRIPESAPPPTAQGTSRQATKASASVPKPRGTAQGRRRASSSRRKQSAARPPRLHEEIETVLVEAGEPLPANVIADRIRERGHYTPPRSPKPLSASNVNSRIGNPTYRSRFVRRDGRIWLATKEGSPAEEPLTAGT